MLSALGSVCEGAALNVTLERSIKIGCSLELKTYFQFYRWITSRGEEWSIAFRSKLIYCVSAVKYMFLLKQVCSCSVFQCLVRNPGLSCPPNTFSVIPAHFIQLRKSSYADGFHWQAEWWETLQEKKESCKCGDVERREGNANCKTDKKLAKRMLTGRLTAALTQMGEISRSLL